MGCLSLWWGVFIEVVECCVASVCLIVLLNWNLFVCFVVLLLFTLCGFLLVLFGYCLLLACVLFGAFVVMFG